MIYKDELAELREENIRLNAEIKSLKTMLESAAVIGGNYWAALLEIMESPGYHAPNWYRRKAKEGLAIFGKSEVKP